MAPAILRTPRLLAYIATWCFGIVAGAAVLNGLVKSRHERDKSIRIAESLSPLPNFTVHISINDVLTVGGFLAAGEILLSMIAFNSALCLFVSSLASPSKPEWYATVHRKTERKGTMLFALGCWLFAFFWTLGTAITLTDWSASRSADVKAFVNGQQLDPKLVDTLQKGAGLNPKYWIHGYTKFAAIAPWPLIFFAIISIVLTFIAYSRTPSLLPTTTVTTGAYDGAAAERTSSSVDESEKKVQGVISRESHV